MGSMPIYEYVCQECRHSFETLVTRDRQPACPSCKSTDLEKQLSVFAVSAKSAGPSDAGPGACGRCGDPRGPGSCSVN
jgi:putative FmdB family regulatory protein